GGQGSDPQQSMASVRSAFYLACALKLLEIDRTESNSSPYIQAQYALVSPSGKNQHMNKLFRCLLVSLFMNIAANAQTIEGDWQGTIKADDDDAAFIVTGLRRKELK